MRGRVGRRGGQLSGWRRSRRSLCGPGFTFLQKYYLDNIGTAKVQIMTHLYIASMWNVFFFPSFYVINRRIVSSACRWFVQRGEYLTVMSAPPLRYGESGNAAASIANIYIYIYFVLAFDRETTETV